MDAKLTVEQIIETDEFVSFYQSAVDFCRLIEKYQPISETEFLQIARMKLVSLYARALRLHWINIQTNVDFNDKLDDKVTKGLVKSIADRLVDNRYYWHVFDSSKQEDKQPVCGDLVDDLGDIYKDLKYAYLIYNLKKPECKETALERLMFDFNMHWGTHCINALSAIHFRLQKN